MITDELLNKYIDNELSDFELKELTEALKNNEEARAKLKALQLTDELLRKMENTPAPQNFTESFMRKINAVSSINKEKISYFFVTVISFLALAITGVIGYSISQINFQSSSLAEKNEYVKKSKEFFSTGLNQFNSILNNENMLLIGAGLTFVLLVSGYFIIENHKNFKQKLNRFGH